MRILLITTQLLMPQGVGEYRATIRETALALAMGAERVAILCHLAKDGLIGWRGRMLIMATGRRVVTDARLGVVTYRTPNVQAAIEDVVAIEKPDVAIVHAHDLASFGSALDHIDVPFVTFVQDCDLDHHSPNLESSGCRHFVADSEFTAQRLQREFGTSSKVIRPIILPELHRFASSRESVVMFDPDPNDRSDIGLGAAARCNEVPFLFALSRPDTGNSWMLLHEHVKRLPNASVAPALTQRSNILQRARFILAPGTCAQGFPRAIGEAQLNGLPAIAAKCRGTADAVGPAGILIESDASLDVWVEAIRRLWADKQRYEQLSQIALRYAQRPEMTAKLQAEHWRDVLTASIENRKWRADSGRAKSCR